MKATIYNDDIDLYVSSKEMLSIGIVHFPGTADERRPRLEAITPTGERILFERWPTQSPDGIAVTRNGNEYLVRFRTSSAGYFMHPEYVPIRTRYLDYGKIVLHNSDLLPEDLKMLFDMDFMPAIKKD